MAQLLRTATRFFLASSVLLAWWLLLPWPTGGLDPAVVWLPAMPWLPRLADRSTDTTATAVLLAELCYALNAVIMGAAHSAILRRRARQAS